VVAGLVVAALLFVFGLVPIWQWLVSAWRGLIHPVPVPLVVLIGMVGALVAVAVGFLLKLKHPPPPLWIGYWQDTFLGIHWRWRYDAGSQLDEPSITPFCPRCGTRLRGEQQGYREMTTSFICDECQFNQEIPGNGLQVIARVARLIEREVHRRIAASPS
jgi:predicted RNA-binding Zn-ribbon protein involved in translation (DUF1610 family)